MPKTSTGNYTNYKTYRAAIPKILCSNFKARYLPALLLILATSSPSYGFKPDNFDNYSIVKKVNDASTFSIEDIIGVSGKDISVRVNLPLNVRRESGSRTWLRVIGLPKELKLSKGSEINKIWFMSVEDLEGLVLKSPKNFDKRFRVKFFLMREDDSVVTIIGKTSINVDLKPAVVTKAAPVLPKPVKKAEPIEKSTINAVPLKIERQTTERAKKFLKMGDIATARMLYENLAIRGSARSAFALGQTYDPEFLKKLLIRGLKPDVEKAKGWYKKALQLGKDNGVNFANGKPVFNDFIDEYARHLGIPAGRLTTTQREVFQLQYQLM